MISDIQDNTAIIAEKEYDENILQRIPLKLKQHCINFISRVFTEVIRYPRIDCDYLTQGLSLEYLNILGSTQEGSTRLEGSFNS